MIWGMEDLLRDGVTGGVMGGAVGSAVSSAIGNGRITGVAWYIFPKDYR